jgi:hypothetical protein
MRTSMSVDAAIARVRKAEWILKCEPGADKHAALMQLVEARHELIHALHSAIEGLGPPFARVLVLDEYERDNLVAHLGLVHEGWFPGNTGDWCGQIRWKIDPAGYGPDRHWPNETPERQIDALRYWKPREPSQHADEAEVVARDREEYTDPTTGELLYRRRST